MKQQGKKIKDKEREIKEVESVLYKHYKGRIVLLVAVANNVITKENYVVFRDIDTPRVFYTMPIETFFGLTFDSKLGTTTLRFSKYKDI